MPGGGIHLRSTHALEQELQCELNQARLVKLTAHDTEVAGRCRGAAARVRWAKLDAIEGVEELGAELQTKFIFRTEIRRLK